ncbi:hypothetical protein CHLRE_02g109716v5 [Chlamydomonas reinhardtii]|uniref:Uncharacterized protein n=1 Tax=Chlamydomonas reinhardtii TaxID=3055 RepID=A0A2K3E2W0_CHLRE|nr:uncharacterized protein CHLRE_02g109716v5 [Chlamydomonas reinhardtii]PNW87116.1 hypothetical protein CHLRE_02g109716v5 [Chlamydomonas reinhardtii]
MVLFVDAGPQAALYQAASPSARAASGAPLCCMFVAELASRPCGATFNRTSGRHLSLSDT